MADTGEGRWGEGRKRGEWRKIYSSIKQLKKRILEHTKIVKANLGSTLNSLGIQ